MSSRRSSTGKPRAGAGSSAIAAAAVQAASHELDKLRALLLESLTSTISDTVETVCEEFEESFAQATRSLPPPVAVNGSAAAASAAAVGSSAGGRSTKLDVSGDGGSTADYDLYYKCCQRLVAYIDANMTTSPDFKQQMDRIILACHSNASERVLSSVVTKRLWFHSNDSTEPDSEQEVYAKQQVYVDDKDEEEDDDDDEVMEVVRTKPPRQKLKASSRTVAAKEEATPRGTKRRAPPPSPPAPVAKSSRHAKAKAAPVAKRARRDAAVRKVKYAPSDNDDDDDDTEEDEPVQRKPTRRQNRIHHSEDEEDDDHKSEEDADDSDEVVLVRPDATSQPHYGQADELLQFKDAIGDMCYAERRTPAQTRFFKDRLRKAIQFVDSQLCKPPKGKACKWECAKIRKQMCNRDLPCRNKICRLWHDVEAHTDRCQNAHCEFRIRVMLRETMYKIDHKKMELQSYRNELHDKKKKLLDLKHENLSDRESYVERRLLDNEISQLEADVESGDRDLGMFKATKKTYWATLNEIGITVDDDVNDQFPEFDAHYVEKKAAAKKKTPTKARKDTTPTATPASSRSQRTRRRDSGASSLNGASALTSPESASQPQRERISRRSTQQSLQAMTNGVIELDDDDDEDHEEEEAKTDRSVEDDEERSSRRAYANDEGEGECDVTYVDGNPETEQTDGAADGESTTKSTTVTTSDQAGNVDGDVAMANGEPSQATDPQEQPTDEAAGNNDEDSQAKDQATDEPAPPSRNSLYSSPSKPARGPNSASSSPAKGLISSVLAMLPGTSALAAFNQAMNSPGAAPSAVTSVPVLVQARPPLSTEESLSPDADTAAAAAADSDSAPLLPF